MPPPVPSQDPGQQVAARQPDGRPTALDDRARYCDNYHRQAFMAEARKSMTELLRAVIADSGMAHIAIERATGVKRASIMRFMRGEQSLRLDLADKLAAFFGVEVHRKRKGR